MLHLVLFVSLLATGDDPIGSLSQNVCQCKSALATCQANETAARTAYDLDLSVADYSAAATDAGKLATAATALRDAVGNLKTAAANLRAEMDKEFPVGPAPKPSPQPNPTPTPTPTPSPAPTTKMSLTLITRTDGTCQPCEWVKKWVTPWAQATYGDAYKVLDHNDPAVAGIFPDGNDFTPRWSLIRTDGSKSLRSGALNQVDLQNWVDNKPKD